MFGCTELLRTQESQRVDRGGRGGRGFGGHIETGSKRSTRVQRRHGVDTGEQRVQVEVPERCHQRVGDGISGGTRERGVDVLEPVTEVEDVVDRSECRQIRGGSVAECGGTGDGELRVGKRPAGTWR
jgi:hypothetical protein